MLVLTRKANQSIRIGDHIILKVIKIKGTTVQLGIDAPADVAILRAELFERQADNQPVAATVSANRVSSNRVSASADTSKSAAQGDGELLFDLTKEQVARPAKELITAV